MTAETEQSTPPWETRPEPSADAAPAADDDTGAATKARVEAAIARHGVGPALPYTPDDLDRLHFVALQDARDVGGVATTAYVDEARDTFYVCVTREADARTFFGPLSLSPPATGARPDTHARLVAAFEREVLADNIDWTRPAHRVPIRVVPVGLFEAGAHDGFTYTALVPARPDPNTATRFYVRRSLLGDSIIVGPIFFADDRVNVATRTAMSRLFRAQVLAGSLSWSDAPPKVLLTHEVVRAVLYAEPGLDGWSYTALVLAAPVVPNAGLAVDDTTITFFVERAGGEHDVVEVAGPFTLAKAAIPQTPAE